jgi:hypothetical protein
MHVLKVASFMFRLTVLLFFFYLVKMHEKFAFTMENVAIALLFKVLLKSLHFVTCNGNLNNQTIFQKALFFNFLNGN